MNGLPGKIVRLTILSCFLPILPYCAGNKGSNDLGIGLVLLAALNQSPVTPPPPQPPPPGPTLTPGYLTLNINSAAKAYPTGNYRISVFHKGKLAGRLDFANTLSGGQANLQVEGLLKKSSSSEIGYYYTNDGVPALLPGGAYQIVGYYAGDAGFCMGGTEDFGSYQDVVVDGDTAVSITDADLSNQRPFTFLIPNLTGRAANSQIMCLFYPVNANPFAPEEGLLSVKESWYSASSTTYGSYTVMGLHNLNFIDNARYDILCLFDPSNTLSQTLDEYISWFRNIQVGDPYISIQDFRLDRDASFDSALNMHVVDAPLQYWTEAPY